MATVLRPSSWLLSRRAALRAAGIALPLPWLSAMISPRARAATARAPRRMAFVYVPNGANMADFTPSAAGADFALPPILEPLAPVRSELLVLSGLAHKEAESKGDGGGAHASAQATFLTAAHSARRTTKYRVGVSVDQVAAQRLGELTRLPSLELSCDKGQQAGQCDSFCACAYQFNLAWRSPSVPATPEVDPRAVFDRLFGDGDASPEAARRRAADASVLDFVRADLGRLHGRLGQEDRGKLDEYATAVREIEGQIQRAERAPARQRPGDLRRAGIPEDYQGHIRVMFDLMAAAFQTDSTRIATFLVAHDGSNRGYPGLGFGEGHHDLSHHGGNAEKKQKVAKINRFHVEQLAYFLDKLRRTRDGEGSLLDHSLVLYGSGISDGNKHNHDDLPILLAGRGGGGVKPGRHLRYPDGTPLANLFVSMLANVGAPVDRFGDSTGALLDLG